MTQEQLLSLLETFTGHLHTSTATEGGNTTYRTGANGCIFTSAKYASHQPAVFVCSSDYFFRQNIQSGRLTKLDEIVSQTLQQSEPSNLRVFVRDVPVRTTQVTGSVPVWAAGASF